MRAVWDLVAGFARFWYGFIIGDDWMAAAGVAVLIGGTWGLLALGVVSWWFGPLVILMTATITVRRALGRREQQQ